jgi:hypothetical protein
VRAFTDKLLARELFRRPLARYNGIAKIAALQAEPKNGIIEKVNQPKLDTFVAGWLPN